MKELTFLLTRQCNWKCSYCSIREVKKGCDEEELLRGFKSTLQLYRREDHLVVNLSGGEPGMLSRKTVYKLLIAIATTVNSVHLNIFTNGTGFWIEDILQRNVRKLRPVIHSYKFIWHCVPDLAVAKRRIHIPRKLRGKVLLSAVVTKKNLEYLDEFLSKNKGLYIFFATHNHFNQQHSLGLSRVDIEHFLALLKQHYGSFALRSMEIPSFILKQGNPSLEDHRGYCSKNLSEVHHVYDMSKGTTRRVKCCVALSTTCSIPDCSECTNYQQFYENALNSYGHTEPLMATN